MALTDQLRAHYPLNTDGSNVLGGTALTFLQGANAPRFPTSGQPANLAPGYFAPLHQSVAPFTPTDCNQITSLPNDYWLSKSGTFDPASTGWSMSFWAKNPEQPAPPGIALTTAPQIVGAIGTDVVSGTIQLYYGGVYSFGSSGALGFAAGDLGDYAGSSIPTNATAPGWSHFLVRYLPASHPDNANPYDINRLDINGTHVNDQLIVDNAESVVNGQIDFYTRLINFTSAMPYNNQTVPQYIDFGGVGHPDPDVYGMCQLAFWDRGLLDSEVSPLYGGGNGNNLGFGATNSAPTGVYNSVVQRP